jgi:hypothetical protein
VIRLRTGALARLAPTGMRPSAITLTRCVRWRRLRRTQKNGTYVSEFAMTRVTDGDLRKGGNDFGGRKEADGVFGQCPDRTMVMSVRDGIRLCTNTCRRQSLRVARRPGRRGAELARRRSVMARFDQLAMFAYGMARGNLVKNRQQRCEGEHRNGQSRKPRRPAGATPTRRHRPARSRSAYLHYPSLGPYSSKHVVSRDVERQRPANSFFARCASRCVQGRKRKRHRGSPPPRAGAAWFPTGRSIRSCT